MTGKRFLSLFFLLGGLLILLATKHSFDKDYYVEENCWIQLKISAAGLRMINKVGLDAALKQAVAKGYVDWKDIKVIGD